MIRFRETVLSHSLRAMFAGSMVATVGMLCQPVLAQESGVEPQRVEVTGSSIKRIVSETSTPLTVIKAEEFIKQGLTTAQEVLSKLPSNQSGLGSGNAVGGNSSGLPTGGQASADLRGLGGDKTLVLLNGRRIANHPYDGASVDLNIIPIAALDRVEVLRDGASAIYGTDAIGGVINFITKRSFKGVIVSGELVRPSSTGGEEKRVNLTGGFGDLNKDGYNVFGVVDYHKQAVVASADREFSKTGVIPSRGVFLTSGTTFPGNYYDATADIAGNPGYASGCNPPYSVPKAGGTTCRQDYTRLIDDLPSSEQTAVFAKGTMKLGENHLATVELLHSENLVNSRTAPPPQTGLVLPNTSKYYPGNSGGVPAQPGLSGDPLSVNWRPLEAGQRAIDSKGVADRVVLGLEGVVADWDYKTGLTYSVSKSSEDFVGGYVKDSSFAAGVANGILNPFALQDAAGKAYLASTALRGQVQSANITTTGIDFKASRELMQMAGGKLAVAFGAELRNEKATFDVNTAIASQASSSGLSSSLPKSGSRNIEAVFGEVGIPLAKDFEVQVAGRFDNYSDVGNTFNPKVGARYQPTKEVLLRASASTGFRAPTLFEKTAPPSRNDTSNEYSDPVFCPGGKIASLPGANPLRDCELQQYKLQGGNLDLKPEKSKTFSLGIVVEPIPEITLAVDYWNIHLTDKIAPLDEAVIYANYEKYKDRFLRFADGTPNAILDKNENLGEVKTSGLDISVAFRVPKTSFGNFVISFDGTYVNNYEYQNERNGTFFDNVGNYGNSGPVFKWRHNASVNWRLSNWSATLAQSYKSGYTDQNSVAAEYKQDVNSYSLWNLSGGYTGFKNLTLTAGIKNLLNTDPPFSNQGTLFQKGYDPRYTDPVGRAYYVRASYAF
jgi:iron complex outermembrane receptor protein